MFKIHIIFRYPIEIYSVLQKRTEMKRYCSHIWKILIMVNPKNKSVFIYNCKVNCVSKTMRWHCLQKRTERIRYCSHIWKKIIMVNPKNENCISLKLQGELRVKNNEMILMDRSLPLGNQLVFCQDNREQF